MNYNQPPPFQEPPPDNNIEFNDNVSMENNDQPDFDSHPVENTEMNQDFSQPEESKSNGGMEASSDQVVPAEPQEFPSQDFPATDVSSTEVNEAENQEN